MLERLFHLAENQTTVRREIVGGVTTFLTMSYIIFVQPAILSDPNGANMNADAVMAATCLASALAIFVMAFWANYPIALAPGMGLNIFFSFTVCGSMGIPWPTALGAVLPSRRTILPSVGPAALHKRSNSRLVYTFGYRPYPYWTMRCGSKVS